MPSQIDFIFPFGKYKNMLVSDVYETDPNYLKWLLDNCEHMTDGLRKAIEYHVG